MGLFLMKNLLRYWDYLSPYNWIVFIAKTASKETGALISSIDFFLLRLLFGSTNLPYNLAWNTVVIFGLVYLIANRICCKAVEMGI